jgi:SIR2-like domain
MSSAPRPVREYVQDWPYLAHYLQATLDPDLIASHGQAILLRALNSRRAVCFLGSGVSMAYGRLGWGELVKRLAKEELSKSGDGDSVMLKHFKRWLEELKIDKRSSGDDFNSGRYPTAYQFIQQLSELRERVPEQGSDENKSKIRDRIRKLLVDDCGHAFYLYKALAEDRAKVLHASRQLANDSQTRQELFPKSLQTDEPLKELVKKLETVFHVDPNSYLRETTAKHNVPNQGGNLSNLAAWREELSLSAVLAGLGAARAQLPGDSPLSGVLHKLGELWLPSQEPLEPLLRFIPLALARLHDSVLPLDKLTELTAHDPNKPRLARSQRIAITSDPLVLLAQHLRVSRFLTTNYDLDLERLIDDLGYSNSDSTDEQARTKPRTSTSPLGARARDGLFDPDRATDLIDFAISDADSGLEVVHLHGRVKEGEPMIVTDRDYLARYLQRGEDADLVNDSLSLAFGANPMLFVGSGMNEDDILRPLRQFVADRKSRLDRPAVVLLPGDGSKAREIEQVISLYSRYGVHTIHFGIGSDGPGESANRVRWLAAFVRLSGLFLSVSNDFLEFVRSPGDADAFRQKLDRTLSDFAFDGQIGSVPKDSATEVQVLESLLSYETSEDKASLTSWPGIQFPSNLDYDCPRGREAELQTITTKTLAAILTGLLEFVFVLSLKYSKSARSIFERFSPSDQHKNQFKKWERQQRKLLDSSGAITPKGPRSRAHLMRIAMTFVALAEGLPSALNGLALTAKLRSIDFALAAWRGSNRRLPDILRTSSSRGTKITAKRPEGSAVWPSEQESDLWLRQPLALGKSPKFKVDNGAVEGKGKAEPQDLFEAPCTDRFFSEAPSQTFEAFLSSLKKDLFAQKLSQFPKDSKTQRRVFVLYADRGAGKGHFYESLRSERRLGEFITWSWPEALDPAVTYAAYAYFNLSFSSEVMSVFSRIADLLVDVAERVFSGIESVLEQVKSANEELGTNRQARLASLLSIYAASSTQASARVLIALSPFNLIFDEHGNPKNADFHRAVMSLLGPNTAKAPIDLICICSGGKLPAAFALADPLMKPLANTELDGWSGALQPYELKHLVRSEVSSKGVRKLQDTVRRIRANTKPGDEITPAALGEKRRKGTFQLAYFHILREAKTSNTIAKYFTEVAFCLARFPGKLRSGEVLESAKNPQTSREQVSQFQNWVLTNSSDFDRAKSMITKLAPALIKATEQMKQARGAVVPRLNPAQFDEPLSENDPLKEDCGELERDFRFMFRSLEQSRFLVTIACAASCEIALPTKVPDNTPSQLAAAEVVNWWRHLIESLATSLEGDKADQAVDFILEHYRQRHRSRLPPPIDFFDWLESASPRPDFSDQEPAETSRLFNLPKGWQLQEKLLWHLAVVGQPVEADVLALTPELGRLLDELLPSHPKLDEIAMMSRRSALLNYALDVLVRRCLVFRLQPAAAHAGGSGTTLWRFTVHRFIQRAIFRKLHAPFVEHSAVDPFGLSLWASQPDDLPRPSQDAALAISDLLAEWTGFPQSVRRVMTASAYHIQFEAMKQKLSAKPTADLSLPARMLRASLGVVRTVYSVGVMSRFHDYSDVAPLKGPEEGLFEQHRLQIRWLIERARELSFLPREDEAKVDAPFFMEELVWLYNECGLYCLVEGRLGSACGLFDLAINHAATLEGSERHGALWCRINMNLALADIERGRIRDAKKKLLAIRSVSDENPVLRLLAHGYLGLIEHYSGNTDVAETIIKSVIGDLDSFGQSRAVAIFSRHLAELYRLRGKDFKLEAAAAADRSVASATKGGHEDVRQMAKLTRIRLAIDGLLPEESVPIQQRLDEIERYGLDMGMPRLIADVSYARAAHLLSLGETRHAASLACKCIEVCAINSLRLRKMTALALLAKICAKRGFKVAAAGLKIKATELAESSDYSNARDSGRRSNGR